MSTCSVTVCNALVLPDTCFGHAPLMAENGPFYKGFLLSLPVVCGPFRVGNLAGILRGNFGADKFIGRKPGGHAITRLLRRILRRVLETAFGKVLRRVLRMCLAVGFRGRKGSEKGS